MDSNRPPEGKQFNLYSNDEKKLLFVFSFKVLNSNMLTITAKEVNRATSYPKIYGATFSKEQLSSTKKNTKITFDDVQTILEHIISSFNSKKLSFILQEEFLILSYFIFDSVQVQITVPFAKDLSQVSPFLYRANNLSNRCATFLKSFPKKFLKLQDTTKTILKEKNEITSKVISSIDSLNNTITHNFDSVKSFFVYSTNKIIDLEKKLHKKIYENTFHQSNPNFDFDFDFGISYLKNFERQCMKIKDCPLSFKDALSSIALEKVMQKLFKFYTYLFPRKLI